MSDTNYTLISFVGTGMYKTNDNFEGYTVTDYHFEDGKHFTTRLFLQALLEAKYKSFDQIILVGTHTSSWDVLVDKDKDACDATIQLWCDLIDECEKQGDKKAKGISQENITRLEKYLTKRFEKEVLIYAHTPIIINDTSDELFECYSNAIHKIKKNNYVLFDITHAFRSMPILLYQVLQHSLIDNDKCFVEVVYGELDISDRKKAYVRNLSNYWKLSETTNAIEIFQSKLDGFKLSHLIETEWPKGSKAIKRFTEIVQTNFSLQVFEVVKQIKNACLDFEKLSEQLQTKLKSIKEVFTEILKLIDEKSQARTLYNYAQYLYAHHLNVQAIITLQVTVETAIAEHREEKSKIGNYEWWQDEGRTYLNKIKEEKRTEIAKPLHALEGFRNQIAHGGGANKKGNFPNAANIPCIYNSAIRGVENLFEELGL